MNVFELFATLGLDSTQYDKGLTDSEEKGKSFGESLGKVVATGAKVGAVAVAAVGTAAIGATTAFAKGITSVSQYGDNIQKTSQKLGLSYEAFQSWDYVMNIAGTSMNNMTVGLKTLTNKLDAAKGGSKDALAQFEALGLSMEDLQSMSREDLFKQVISGFQGMADSTERAALANDFFGRSGQELTPLFNMSKEETQDLIDKANEYGMVMSDSAVEASAKFKDEMTTLTTTMSGLKNNLMSEFLPSISTVISGLSAVFAGDDSGLGQIDEGVNNFIEQLNKTLPKMLEIGGRILGSLMSAISKNLPELIRQGSSIISQLISGIVTALPDLLDSALLIIEQIGSALFENAEPLMKTALSLIMKLAEGFTRNAPTIIPAIVSVFTMIVRTLTEPETLSQLIRVALQLILALADGIVKALPELAAVIPEIIVNLTTVLIETFPDVLETVFMLLGALGTGVLEFIAGLMGTSLDEALEGWSMLFSDMGQWAKDIIGWLSGIGKSITTAITKIWTSITSFFTKGIDNLKEKAETGLNNIKQTFVDIFEKVKTAVQKAIDFLKGLFKFDWSLPKIKLPHFKVSGGEAPWGFGGQGSLPKIGVEWYKKAMETPFILNSPTIFGAANGKLLGGGESGSEVVVGTNKLMDMMRQAMGVESKPINIYIYGAAGQDVRMLAKEVSKELQNLKADKEKAYA